MKTVMVSAMVTRFVRRQGPNCLRVVGLDPGQRKRRWKSLFKEGPADAQVLLLGHETPPGTPTPHKAPGAAWHVRNVQSASAWGASTALWALPGGVVAALVGCFCGWDSAAACPTFLCVFWGGAVDESPPPPFSDLRTHTDSQHCGTTDRNIRFGPCGPGHRISPPISPHFPLFVVNGKRGKRGFPPRRPGTSIYACQRESQILGRPTTSN